MASELFILHILKLITSRIAGNIEKRSFDWIAKVLSAMPARLPLQVHYRELRTRVRDMPFIYKDLDSDVLADFVDVELETVDLETFAVVAPQPLLKTNTEERMKRHRKVLIIGNAGVGKTTFMRHTILRLIDARGRVPELFGPSRMVAFYVPLKNIDNLRQYPILQYLLSTNSLLGLQTGLKTLIRLAENNQLVLFLDAYDECPAISFEGTTRSFLREELGLLFSPGMFESHEFMNDRYRNFYNKARSCRIWLSSRRDFIAHYPLAVTPRIATGSGAVIANQTTVAVELKGIGKNRAELVKKIFAKYKARSLKYGDLLNEEYFLQELEYLTENELATLSYNPLFLTVMCYVYVTKVLESNSHDVAWSKTVPDLIIECINLLLFDLDEAKVRGLPSAHRDAILRRRNAFKEEKLHFLRYFAANVILSAKPVFDRRLLETNVKDFFEHEHRFQNSPIILAELQKKHPLAPTFTEQLIISGVFVIVDRSSTGPIYDFPHRRFREILAIQYLDVAPDPRAIIQQLVSRADLLEFLYVSFSLSKLQDEILQALLGRSLEASDTLVSRVICECLKRKPHSYDASETLRQFIRDCLEHNRKFALSEEVLSYISPNIKFLLELLDTFKQAVTLRDPLRLSLCTPLLFKLSSLDVLTERLGSQIEIAMKTHELRTIIFRYTNLAGWTLLESFLTNVLDNEESFFDLSYFLTRFGSGASDHRVFARFILDRLNLKRKDQLFGFASRFNAELLADWARAGILSREEEVSAAIARTIAAGRLKPGQHGYVVTREVLSVLSQEMIDGVQVTISENLGQLRAWLAHEIDELVPERSERDTKEKFVQLSAVERGQGRSFGEQAQSLNLRGDAIRARARQVIASYGAVPQPRIAEMFETTRLVQYQPPHIPEFFFSQLEARQDSKA